MKFIVKSEDSSIEKVVEVRVYKSKNVKKYGKKILYGFAYAALIAGVYCTTQKLISDADELHQENIEK